MSFYHSCRHLIFGGAALSTAIFGACNKTTPAPDANTSLLGSHPWRIVAFTDTDNTTNPPKTVNAFTSFPAYRLDDTYQFKLDNSLTFEEGALKAKASDAQSATGSWQFQNAQARLTITLGKAVALGTTGSTSSSTYSILKLSADTLRITTGTQAQTVVVTLTK